MIQASLEIRRISAHPGPVPGANVERESQVCKLIDTTTCIGCKACEVACVEWNGYAFRETFFDNTYQTMPETEWNYWNLIKFNEYEREDGTLMLLMRKDQCMHCAEPGCLIACPADGAIVQYANGIVDFQQEHCIGCGYCITGCPFNIPKFNSTTEKVFKCTLCSDRVSQGLEPACIKACPTGCLQLGTKDDMKDVAETRAKQLRENYGFEKAGVYDPPGVAGAGVIYVLHDATNPEAYGGLPKDPHIPWVVRLWKGPAKWIGNLAMFFGIVGVTLHYLRFGPKQVDDEKDRKGPAVSASQVISPARTAGDMGDQIIRYTLSERINHWIAALSYMYCMVTGLAFWSPYMFWLATLAGGGPTARFWHPWMGLVYTGSAFWMYKVWRSDMLTRDADRSWWRAVKYYIRNDDENLPPIGRFNYGQKQFFWLMFYGAILLLLSGLLLWFIDSIPWNLRWLRYFAIAVHVAAALPTIGGFIIHVYMGTAMVRGGFTAIIRGEVSSAWARTHHRLWYEQMTKQKSPRQ